MLKRMMLALFTIAGLAAPALGAGTINLSLSQQFDSQGVPLSGCLLYFFQAGTLTPQNAFQDSALTITWPNPMSCDSSGRIPQFYLADGSIKVRLTDKTGVTVLAADGLLVIGPSGGGGGGSSVDATTVLATGDVKTRYGVGPLTGFVRANGRTIGSATSGASERANADTQPLFEYLWNADVNLTVSGGRGASSTADFLANKTITLPDGRGRVVAGLDDMGNSAAGVLTSASFAGLSPITLGAKAGAQTVALAGAQIPALSGTGTVSVTSVDTSVKGLSFTPSEPFTFGGGTTQTGQLVTALSQGSVTSTGSATVTIPNASQTAVPLVQPTLLATIYIKL